MKKTEIGHKCLTCPLLQRDIEESDLEENEKVLNVEHFPSSWARFSLKGLKELLSKPLRT